MTVVEKLVKQPIFFDRNRVYRIYRGGMPYKELFADGYDDGEDNNFPEEWVASKVHAINPVYFSARDGVSKIEGSDVYFDDLLTDYKDDLLGDREYDCLVKFLDSAMRLPFQVHPTRAFSQEHFGSRYGKTEAWLVVGTRPGAKIYFGFNRYVSKEELSRLEIESESNPSVMEGILTSVPARVGDVWLIKAGLVHAIGAGCTIIEIQEPTDYTIQPERWCGDYHISQQEEFLGLTKDIALDAINYDIWGNQAKQYAMVYPNKVVDTPNYEKHQLITYDDTPCFALNKHVLREGGSFCMDSAPAVYIVLDGSANIVGKDYERCVKRGQYFFLPRVAEGAYCIQTSTSATLVECLPSQQDKK